MLYLFKYCSSTLQSLNEYCSEPKLTWWNWTLFYLTGKLTSNCTSCLFLGALHITGIQLLCYYASIVLTFGLSTQDLGSGSDADQGSESKDHFASTQAQSGSELRAWDPVQDGNARSMRAMRSSRDTTMNTDRETGSGESGFSARVESPIVSNWCTEEQHWLMTMCSAPRNEYVHL